LAVIKASGYKDALVRYLRSEGIEYTKLERWLDERRAVYAVTRSEKTDKMRYGNRTFHVA